MHSTITKTRSSMLALVLSVASAPLLSGCGGGAEPEGSGTTEETTTLRQAQARDILSDMGVASDAIEFHTFEGQELVRINGNLNLSVDALLDGKYAHRLDGVLVEKAFKSTSGNTPPVGTGFSKNLRLAFAGGSQTPFSDDQTLLKNAATSWSTTTFTSGGVTQTSANLDIRTSNTGSTITIHMMPGVNWPTGTPCAAGDIACIDVFPSGSGPAPNIYYRDFLNPFGNANQCEWTTSQLTKTFLHELGHSIGFTHPGAGTQVSGTLPCGAGNACTTVMARGGTRPVPDCTNPLDSLQSDDRDAVTTVY